MAERPRRRTTFGPTLAVGLAGAALALAGSTQPWAEATTRTPALRTVTAGGADVAALALPLALVSLAAWGTVLVLRARGRRAVSLLGVVASVGAAVSVVVAAPSGDETAARLLGAAPAVSATTTAWPFVTGVAALLSAAAFVVAILKAPTWPEMSSRYDAPVTGPPVTGAPVTGAPVTGAPADGSGRPTEELTDAELWKALDEGRDPTA